MVMFPDVSSYNPLHCATGDTPARKIVMVTPRHGTAHAPSKKQPLRTLLRRIFRGFVHHDTPRTSTSSAACPREEKDVPVLTFIDDTSEGGDYVTVVPFARRKRLSPGPCILCTAVLGCPMEPCRLQRQGARRHEATRALRAMHRHPSQGYYPSDMLHPPSSSDPLGMPGGSQRAMHDHAGTSSNAPKPYTSLMAQISQEIGRGGLIHAGTLFGGTDDPTIDEAAHADELPVLGVRQRRSSAWAAFLEGGQPATCGSNGSGSSSSSRRRKNPPEPALAFTSTRVHDPPRASSGGSGHRAHLSHVAPAVVGVTSFPVGRTVSAHSPGGHASRMRLRRMSSIGLEIMAPLRPIAGGSHKRHVAPLEKMEQIDDDEDMSQSSGSSANNSPRITESDNDTDE
ncbi:hypothetical protein SYNPS1DRAFT_30504 [Syncephalis pseudoplumigaleata]|uniref:Uncharacterized protein n=1 Tax=Syncephalis pseudoplumigaleata TaxID=1712513 RepID=A0A4V1J141_9FUNG|nr:hypothetical protein SYNPS1DRAFT_30504 [Syncephalis pseudoplumigaleata]|eukprot:RKP23739.1 hypothetical protein SYNPS1DRAFT_30504 [Syncephalis pseudoplumigaleata]